MLKTVGFPSTRTGDQTIVDGNLVIGTAGKGIDFSADPSAAGMTSELLDDYEEGTWTPTQGANLVVVGSFSASGKYTKVGRLVTVNAILQGSTSIAWGAGSAEICLGLPFAASNIGSGIAINNAYSFGAAILAGATGIYSGEAMPATAFVQFSVSYTV